MATPFITLSEFKTEAGITVSTYDTKLQNLIDVSASIIYTACRRDFKNQVFTEYFDTPDNTTQVYNFFGSNELGETNLVAERKAYLKGYPIDSGSAFKVYYDSARLFPESSLVEDTLYYYDTDTSKLTILFATIKAPRSLKIIYTAGWAAAGSPATLSATADAELKRANLIQAMYMYVKTDMNNLGVSDERSSGAGISEFSTTDTIAPEIYSVIAKYRTLLPNGFKR